MCGSCALLTFAMGFFNSVEHTQSAYFEEFAHYDVMMEFAPIPLTAEHLVTEHLDRINKVLAAPVKIDDKEYRLFVVENDFDMQNIETQRLQEGIILPDFPPAYNVIFAKTGDLAALSDLSLQYGFGYSTLEDARMGFASVMENLNALIWFMLVCPLTGIYRALFGRINEPVLAGI